MPELAVVVTTYMPPGELGRSRMNATLQVIRSWDQLLGPDSEWPIIVADDGSAIDWLEEFSYMLTALVGTSWKNVSTPRLGCGAAFAAGATAAIEAGATAVFYAQDDWELMEPLDLAPSLALLDDFADVVRLGPTHPGLRGHVVRTDTPDAEWCLEYEWSGGGYVMGWRPAIYHTTDILQPEDLAGLEGLSAIEAERVWMERYANRRIPPRVFHAPNCTLAGPFRHIETVELGEDDPATLTARYA